MLRTAKDERSHKSLEYSYKDGAFAAAMTGFTQDFFAPFLLLLGGTARHIGMLNALPNLCAALVQLKSPDFSEWVGSRRVIVNSALFLQACMLIPMACVAFEGGTAKYAFIAMVVLFTAFNAVAMPPWSSIMCDLVREDKRGEFFGWRNKALGYITVATSFTAGGILTLMKKINVYYGFGILFASACAFRFIAWWYLIKMHEPPIGFGKEHRFGFIRFLSRVRHSNFARFSLFVAFMNFTVNLAAPFFSVLMLRDLHFSYFTYAVVVVSAPLTINGMMGRWGKIADKTGNLKIIKITAPLIGCIPLLWVLNRHPLFLIFAQVFSGFMWAGFNLCASNFIYDSVRREKRTRCIAYFNTLNGLGLCAGALIGGYIQHWLPPLFGYNILTLLVISSFMRLCAALTIPRFLKEVRPVTKIKSNRILSCMIGLNPLSMRE